MNKLTLTFFVALLLTGAVSAQEPLLDYEQMAVDAARDALPNSDRLEVESTRTLRAGRHAGNPDGVVRDVVGPNSSGIFRVRVGLEGTEPLQDSLFQIRGKIYGPAVVAIDRLSSRTLLSQADLTVREVELTRLAGEPAREIEQVAGRSLSRSYGADQPIRSRDVVSPPVAKRGEWVSVTLRSGALRIRTTGKLLSDAAAGEIVPVQNMESGRRYSGRINANGEVEVIVQ